MSLTKSEAEAESSVSVFLPDEALQGEEIPSFALWEGEGFDSARILIPETLQVKDVFNVSADSRRTEGQELIINKVERNGYIGLLFASVQSKETSQSLRVKYTFRFKGREIEEERRVHVYKPLLASTEVPPDLNVNATRKAVDKPFVITNKGYGTVLVQVEASSNSEVRLNVPVVESEFRSAFNADVAAGLSLVKERFPKLSPLVELIETFITNPPNLEDPKPFQDLVEKFRKAATEDLDFGKAVGDAIASALITNMYHFNTFQQFSAYFASIQSSVIIRNPIESIHVTKKRQRLRLRVHYTDLTFGDYPPIKVDAEVHAVHEVDIPVYELFKWEVEK